jgi:hypothetical protein
MAVSLGGPTSAAFQPKAKVAFSGNSPNFSGQTVSTQQRFAGSGAERKNTSNFPFLAIAGCACAAIVAIPLALVAGVGFLAYKTVKGAIGKVSSCFGGGAKTEAAAE